MWEVFHAALERAPAERWTYLDSACGSDVGLREQVEGLLASHDQAGQFLEEPVATRRHATVDLEKEHTGPKMPERIGNFTIRRVIGAGGMGIVYEAEQRNPRRSV